MKLKRYKIVSIVGVSAGLLLTPAIASASTATTTISSVIGAGINLLTTTGTVDISAVPNGSGVQTTAKDTVTVSTNDSAGYTLVLAETTADSALKSGSNSIGATTGTKASPTALVAGKWGYRVDGLGTFGSGPTSVLNSAAIGTVTYAAVPATASPDQLKATSSTASNDTTDVWYSVAVDTSTPSGTYTNSVTYTATAN
jgi:hypothetical protein